LFTKEGFEYKNLKLQLLQVDSTKVSSETLLLENDKSFACGDEDSWPILEDPALLLGIFSRRSMRIAARNWPRGDTQAKARQVLMKRLGILDNEGLSHDDLLPRYFSLFKGPLTDVVMKALTALCGLDAASAASTPQV